MDHVKAHEQNTCSHPREKYLNPIPNHLSIWRLVFPTKWYKRLPAALAPGTVFPLPLPGWAESQMASYCIYICTCCLIKNFGRAHLCKRVPCTTLGWRNIWCLNRPMCSHTVPWAMWSHWELYNCDFFCVGLGQLVWSKPLPYNLPCDSKQRKYCP